MSQAYDFTSLSSEDEELLPSVVVRTPAETRAFNMRMIASLGESLDRVSIVRHLGLQSYGLFTPNLQNCQTASRELSALKVCTSFLHLRSHLSQGLNVLPGCSRSGLCL